MTVLQFIEVVKRFRDVSGQDFTTSNKAAAMAAMNSILGLNKYIYVRVRVYVCFDY